MRQLARRAQGRLIDFIQQRLDWDVIDVRVEEDEGYHDDPTVLRIELTAEYELEEDNEYRRDGREEAR